jgi:SNF2 family DNA or RNA helicase
LIFFCHVSRTRDTLDNGNLLSVINVLMQLRKVCNHPNLFEERPVISPFVGQPVSLQVPGLVAHLQFDRDVSLSVLFSWFVRDTPRVLAFALPEHYFNAR